MFFPCVPARGTSGPSPSRGSSQSRACHSAHVRFMFPADARSTSAAAARFPKYHIASTSRWSASTLESSSFDPVTMLITPAGTSEVSSTLYSSVAASGWASDGIATTVFPTAMAGATSETNPSSGSSSGAAMPSTPIGSFISSEAPTVRRHDRAGRGPVGARPGPADEHLVGAIDCGERGGGSSTIRSLTSLGPPGLLRGPLPAPRSGLPLRLQVLPHPLPPALAPEAGLSIAAEPARRVEDVRAVDPHHTGLDLRRHVERQVDVLRPHARGEAVRRVVRELDRLLGRAEAHRDEDRTEDLDLRDRRRRGDVGEQGGRIEVALGGAGPRRLPHGGALLHALRHEPADAL